MSANKELTNSLFLQLIHDKLEFLYDENHNAEHMCRLREIIKKEKLLFFTANSDETMKSEQNLIKNQYSVLPAHIHRYTLLFGASQLIFFTSDFILG